MSRARRGVVALIATLALGGSAVPVFAADNGTVNAQVTATEVACILVLPASTVDFGSAGFNAQGVQNVTVAAAAIRVTSCSGASQTLFGKGTDATAGAATWNLVTTPQCSTTGGPLNQYNLGLRSVTSDTYLATTDTSLGSLASSGSYDRTAILRMPCTGSSGTGQSMTMSYVFTATV